MPTSRIIAVGEPAQLCIRPTAIVTCPTFLGPIFNTAQLPTAIATANVTGSITLNGSPQPYTPTSATVQIAAVDPSYCSASLTGTALIVGTTVPVAGATLTLKNASGVVLTYPSDYGDPTKRGQPITTTTAADGTYSFNYLVAGAYQVQFADTSTAAVQGTNVAAAGTGATAEATTAITTLTSRTSTIAIGTPGVIDATYGTLPTLTKAFLPTTIAVGESGTLVFTITNAASGAVAAPARAGIGFVDTLPTGLQIDLVNPNMKTTCPSGTSQVATATVSTSNNYAAATSGTFTVANATMTAGVTSCTFSVNVVSVATGSYLNNNSNLTTTGLAENLTATELVVPAASAGATYCDGLFYSVDAGVTRRTDPVTGASYQFGPATTATFSAFAYNSVDGFFYGIAKTADAAAGIVAGDLLRWSSSGVITDLGLIQAPTGITAATALAYFKAAVAGEFDNSGNLYIKATGGVTSIYSINVSNKTSKVINLVTAANAAFTLYGDDFAYRSGKLYSLNAQNLYAITIGSSASWLATSTTWSTLTTNSFVSAYSNSNGEIFFNDAVTGKTYKITNPDSANSTNNFTVTTTTSIGFDDGAMCHAVPKLSKAFSASSAKAGEVFSATFTVTNAIGNPALSGLAFTDTLPSGVKVALTPNIVSNCPSAIVTALANSGTIKVDAITMTAGLANCSVTVDLVADNAGTFVNSTSNVVTTGLDPPANAQITVTPPLPVANPDSSIGAYGASQTVNPLTNDNFGVGVNATANGVSLVATSVKLCAGSDVAPNCTATSVTTPEGTYTVNTATGAISFSPVAGFTGSPTPVTYSVSDNLGNEASSLYQPKVLPPPAPTATNDTSSGLQDVNQVMNPLTNDAAGAAGVTFKTDSVRLCSAGQTSPNCTATSVTVAGQGTYTVDTVTGLITFDPEPSFTGTATPVRYVVQDITGQTASAIYTPKTSANPVAVTDATSGPMDVNQTESLLDNDSPTGGATFVASKLFLCDPATAQTAPNCNATSVTIAGQGTYTLNQATGVVTFDPEANFSGTATPLAYQVTDTANLVLTSTYTPTVIPAPVAVSDTSSGNYLANQVISPLANDSANSATTLVASTIKYCGTGETPNNCTKTSGTITTADGVYTINLNGTLTFTPDAHFVGVATQPLKYQVADALGQIANAIITPSVNDPIDPTASPSIKTVLPGGSVAFPTLTGTSGLAQPGATNGAPAITSVCLIDPVTSICTTGQTLGKPSVTTADGTFVLDPATSVVTFNALSNATSGTLTAITYKATDAAGQTVSSTLTPIVPAIAVLTPDTSSGGWDINQTISPLANDTNIPAGSSLVPSTLRLCAPTETAPNCTQTTLVVTGKGTYTVNSDGTVTFDPLPTFSGTAPPVTYSVEDNFGRAISSTITITVAATNPPTALPDTQSVLANVNGGPVHSVLFDSILVSTNTTSALASPGTTPIVSVCLLVAGSCDADGSVTNSDGTYVLNSTTGVVTFTPAIGVTASSTLLGISYKVTDSSGGSATSTLTPVIPPIPTANPDKTAGELNIAQTVSPIANDVAGPATAPLDATTVKLCDPNTSPPEVAPNCTLTTLTIAGQGTYVVDPITGNITFTPETGYTGTATAVGYQISDTLGQVASSTYQPTVYPQPAPSALPDTGTEAWTPTVIVVINPLSNDNPGTIPAGTDLAPSGQTAPSVTADPTSVKLCAVGESAPTCTATTLTTADGTYTVNTTTGFVTFDPVDGFTGTVTVPVTYQYSNVIAGTFITSGGPYTPTSHVASSTITPIITPPPPITAVNDATTGRIGLPQTINLATNDTGIAGSATVKLCSATDVAPNCSLSRVVVTGVGVYEVSGTTITFTPEANYIGTPPALTYVITDALGGKGIATYTPTVTPVLPPTATAETKDVLPGATISFTTITGNSGLASAGSGTLSTPLTCLISGRDPATQAIISCVQTLSTPDGTWTVDPLTSIVSYASKTGSTAGTKVTVEYQVTDSLGQTAVSTLTPIVPPPPVASPDVSSGNVNTPQVINVLNNDAAQGGLTLTNSTTKLCDAGQSVPNCTATSVTIPGQGTFTVAASGVVTFTPDTGFYGPVNPIGYQVSDSLGQVANSTITVSVVAPAPTANPDYSTGLKNATQTFSITVNDSTPTGFSIVPATARLCGVGQVPNACTATSVTIAGEGIYTLAANGTVSFVPALDYFGTATQLKYIVRDNLNQVTSSTINVTVTAVVVPPPVAVSDSSIDLVNVIQTFDILSNDTAATGATLISGSVRLCDASETAPNCTKTSVYIANQGTYSIDTAGLITFVPVQNYTGTATPITYIVQDSLGKTASAQIQVTVTPVTSTPSSPAAPAPVEPVKPTPVPQPDPKPVIPRANPDRGSGPQNTIIVLTPVANDTKGTAELVAKSIVLCSSDCDSIITAPTQPKSPITTSQGTWSVASDTGQVIFSPKKNWFGIATLKYVIFDVDGNAVQSTITVEIPRSPKPKIPKLPKKLAYTGDTFFPLSAISKAPSKAEPMVSAKKALHEGDFFATITAPRLGTNWSKKIFEGTSVAKVLTPLGLGHYETTQLPGEAGNFAIAGHRFGSGGPFLNIDKFRNGDLVFVRTKTETFTYRFLQSKVVKPTEVGVLSPQPSGLTVSTGANSFLTLQTCTPVHVNTDRLIVWFELISST